MFAKATLTSLFLASIFLFHPDDAQSQDRPLNLRVLPKGKQTNLQKETLYAVEITCKATGELQPYEEWSGIIKKTYTTSHNIILATQPPTKKSDNTDQLPNAAIAATTIFSTDGKTQALDNRDACDQSYLVRRVENLFLVPSVNLSTTHEPGFFLQLFSKLIDVATSSMPLFMTGVPLTAATAKLADIKKVDDPLKNLIAALNQQKNYARTVNLRVGTTSVITDFSTVKIRVRRVDSIVGDKNRSFVDDLRKQIQNAPEKLTAADIPATCILAATTLNNAGIKADADKAYAIGFLALKSFADKRQIARCLGRSYARTAVKLGDVLWKGLPSEVALTDKDLDELDAPEAPSILQPSFQDVRSFLDRLMVALGQYARNKPVPPETSNPIREAAKVRLRSLFSGTVTIEDNTHAGTFGGGAKDYGNPDLVDALVAKGFNRYGCFAEATDATGKYANGAVAIFLSFLAAPDANKVSKSRAIAIHPLFYSGVIRRISVSDKGDWISNVLSNRDKADDCNGLEIEDEKVASIN
jgi:hypothetical protein